MSIFNTVPPLAAGPGMKFDGETFSTAAAPHNLLDNSDFRNPVNQRGQTSYGTEGYTIDRWLNIIDIGVINVVQGGLNLDAANHAITFAQYLDDDTLARMAASGRKYTVVMNYTVHSVGNDANLFERSKGGGINRLFGFETGLGNHTSFASFTPDATGENYKYAPVWMYLSQGWNVTLHWAALYEGEYTVENLPDYQPKGYVAEYMECQRYLYKVAEKEVDYSFILTPNSLRNLDLTVVFPVEMRVAPSLFLYGGSTVRIIGYTSTSGFSGPHVGMASNVRVNTVTKRMANICIDMPFDFNNWIFITMDTMAGAGAGAIFLSAEL